MSPKSSNNSIRPTKKQRELLTFIERFIGEHGYSPSYREIMSGQGYTSVATVALHVNSLIKRGHLRKRDRSARSLEVTDGLTSDVEASPSAPKDSQWLVSHLESLFKAAEAKSEQIVQKEIDDLYVLVGALKVLGAPEASSFIPRLQAIKVQASEESDSSEE